MRKKEKLITILMSYTELLQVLSLTPAHFLLKITQMEKKERETKEEDNCHLVPGDVLQSYPCHRQEVIRNVGQMERYQGFPEGNLRLQDTGSRGPRHPSLYLQVQ